MAPSLWGGRGDEERGANNTEAPLYRRGCCGAEGLILSLRKRMLTHARVKRLRLRHVTELRAARVIRW